MMLKVKFNNNYPMAENLKAENVYYTKTKH